MKRQTKFLFIFILYWHVPAWALSDELATVKAIQKNYESVLTLKANFEQKAFVKMLNRTEVTRGNCPDQKTR